jgi:hypothetical protein
VQFLRLSKGAGTGVKVKVHYIVYSVKVKVHFGKYIY